MFFFVLACFLTAASAENPSLVAHVDLNPLVGTPGPYSSVQFLTGDLVLISNGQSSPRYAIFDLASHRVLATGVSCALTGRDAWATPAGNILVACAQGLVLYDRNFHELAQANIPLSRYTVRDSLTFSPTRKLVAVNPLPRQATTRVLNTDTLAEVATYQAFGVYVYGISESGYSTYETSGQQEDVLTFHSFQNSPAVELAARKQRCAQAGFGVSESEFLRTSCGKDNGEIIDLKSGQSRLNFPGSDDAVFAQTTTSGKRFALGFQGYTKGHELKKAINPMTYVIALGTCCDDPDNLFKLRVYDQRSGGMLAEFRWQTKQGEPMWERYDNSAVALSPDGEHLALLHGVAAEIYRIPSVASQ